MSNRLSLLNTVVSYDQLSSTPSRKDKVPEQLETDLRTLGCELIQTAGILLRLPQVAMASAQVLFQRFFYVASAKKFGVRDVAMGALFLASKIEECPRKIRDIINVFAYAIAHLRRQPTEPIELFGKEFYDMKNGLIVAEMQILKRLGFSVHIQLPYALMVNYLSALDLTETDDVPQRAWSYLNDALRTNVYVCYQPPTIACAVIYLAARTAGVTLPTNPPWWEIFDAELEDLENIAGVILSLYARQLPIHLPLTVKEMEEYLLRKSVDIATADTQIRHDHL